MNIILSHPQLHYTVKPVKVATCVSSAALNGTKGGQHRQVLLYLAVIPYIPDSLTDETFTDTHSEESYLLQNHSTLLELNSKA
jgi:hypothetical protein